VKMPIFYLEPRNGDVSDPSWAASNLKEGCWVEAETEAQARLRVEGATLKMLEIKPGRKLIFPPWQQARLTDCRLDDPPQKLPAGKIVTKSGKLIDA
jgi:hypothetical protein